ncbi:hypothetical protein NP233_g1379 [Leucocoprinus birnbaumii]|uniref:DNA endonuclease activator Ctp1 C-terminal domain-containing protein n=1 Tax=Leucocoprinus birnbaumii TaxID=56174 RepID=A0AAD5YVW0_9AGAR|nr:hypothetical protein NP233_g1379 [Leucocoprinus birnbaumii]
MTTTFSSAQMRERDRLIEEKHKKELEAAERRHEKLKRVLENTDKQNFTFRHQVQRLVECLGFADIDEAQRAFDVADHEVTFHQAFERVQILEDELRKTKSQNEILESRCQELQRLLEDEQKHSAALEKAEKRHEQVKADSDLQFHAVQEKARRAQALFIEDRRVFWRIYRWLCLEPIDQKPSRVERIDFEKFQSHNTQRRRAILREFGPDLSKLLGIDNERIDRLMQAAQDAEFGPTSQPAEPTNDPVPPRVDTADSDANASLTVQSSSDRQPLSTLPANQAVKLEPVDTPKHRTFGKIPSAANSSDTEDDSQAPSQFLNRLVPVIPLDVNITTSSDTEDDSQAPRLYPSSPINPPATSPFSAVKPTVKQMMYGNLLARLSHNPSRAMEDTVATTSGSYIKPEPEDDTGILTDERPAKKPRLSLGLPIQTPKAVKPDFAVPRRVFSTGRMAKEKKLLADENTPVGKATTFTRLPGQTRMDAYALSKGSGRYGKQPAPATKTINSMFTINPERNGGVTHQYEQVVRDKAERMRMDAGDCEECRDWYTAIGPLPTRDRGPLWRSPSTTPIKRCKRHNHHDTNNSNSHDREVSPSPSDRRQTDIELHKKQVSRHRQNWARSNTPPGYWNIGFPDTQEARVINEQAEEMHQRKFREVEREVERGSWSQTIYCIATPLLVPPQSLDVDPLSFLHNLYSMAMTKSHLAIQLSKSKEAIHSDKSATSITSRASILPRTARGLKTPIRRFFFRFEALKPTPSGIGNKRSRSEEYDVDAMDPLVDTPPLSSDIATSPMSELDTPDAGQNTYDLCSPGQQDTPTIPCMALQNSDHSIDAVIISTLLKLPFCCHENLLTMSPDRILEVAHEINERLPDALKIDLNGACDYIAIRKQVERLVGIVKSIEKVSVPGAPLKRTKSRGRRELGRVTPGVDFLAHLDLRAISPPTSPLAFISETRMRRRVGHADVTAVMSPSKLGMLKEEDEDEGCDGDQSGRQDIVGSAGEAADEEAEVDEDIFRVAKRRRTTISSPEIEMITPTMRRIKVPLMLTKLYDNVDDTSPTQHRVAQAGTERQVALDGGSPIATRNSRVIIRTTVIDRSLADTRARYRSSNKFIDIRNTPQIEVGLVDGPMHTSTPKLGRAGRSRRMTIVSPIRRVRRLSVGGGGKGASPDGSAVGKSAIPRYNGFSGFDMLVDGDSDEDDTNEML